MGALTRQYAEQNSKFAKPEHGQKRHAAKLRLLDANRRDVQYAKQEQPQRVDDRAVQGKVQREQIEKRREHGARRDRHAEVVGAVLAHLVLPLLFRHVEIGEADERAEREKRHRRKDPESIAVHAPADGGGQHAEAHEVVERVDLDTEALFLFGAVLFRAGDAPVEGWM